MPIEVDRKGVADLLGVSVAHIGRLIGEGLPVLVTGGGRGNASRFDAVACLDWWRQRQAEAEDHDAGKEARNAYTEALGERVRLDIDERRKVLVSREVVVLAGQSFVKAWSAKVRALPRQLVQSGALAREHEAAAARACRELLEEISTWKTVADTTRARRARTSAAGTGRRRAR